MPTLPPSLSASSLSVNEILFILFKHKWKVIPSSVAGVAAAAAMFFLYPHTYESQAKILVRYVVENSSVDPQAVQAKGIYIKINLTYLIIDLLEKLMVTVIY